MTQRSLKNDASSLCYDVFIMYQNFKIDIFRDFRAKSIITVGLAYLGVLSPL